jgi:hypothetical protein
MMTTTLGWAASAPDKPESAATGMVQTNSIHPGKRKEEGNEDMGYSGSWLSFFPLLPSESLSCKNRRGSLSDCFPEQ